METTTTTIICKNCEVNFQGNFCSNCGQSAHTHSINWHYVWHEIEHGIFHVDKGLFYTIKELFTSPGKTIRHFIAGKRSQYFKPAAMVFLLASIYGFLYHYFDINIKMPTFGASSDAVKVQDSIYEWMIGHFALVTLLTIPLYAIGSFLAFKKSGYNFVEHLVLNSFLAGQKLVVQLALLPVVVYYNSTGVLSILMTALYLIDIALTGWTYGKFFNKFKWSSRILRTVLAYTILMTTYIVGGIIIGIISTVIKLWIGK